MRCSRCSSTATSTCPPTRPRRSARPACSGRCTSNWRRRQTFHPRGSLQDGSLIPLVVGDVLSAAPSRRWLGVAVAQRRRHRADPGDHPRTQHRVPRSRSRPEKPHRQSWTSSSHTSTTRPATSSRATDSLNNLAGQVAEQKPVVDRALEDPPARARRAQGPARHTWPTHWTSSASSPPWPPTSTNQSKDNLVKNLQNIAPVLKSLADAGPALTRSLDFYSTFPFPKPTLSKWIRGDYANLTAVIDLTLSRHRRVVLHRHPLRR